MKRTAILSLLSCFILFLLSGCAKSTDVNNRGGTDSTGTSNGTAPPSGNVAAFDHIPIPGTDINSGVLPNPVDFFSTNIGPYIQLQNLNVQISTVLKYRGGTGDDAWITYPGESAFQWAIPLKLTDEDKDELGFMWSLPFGSYDYAYGEGNIGNGSPISYKYQLHGVEDTTQPYIFSKVFPPSNSVKIWAFDDHIVWLENGNAEDFQKIYALDGYDQFYQGMVDSDDANEFWCSAEQKLFHFTAGVNSIKSWDLSSLGPGTTIVAIVKAGGTIFIQCGLAVLMAEGDNLKQVGTLQLSNAVQAGTSAICSNGSMLYASDGNAFDPLSGQWHSFIGSGVGLNSDETKSYRDLQQYCSTGQPIAATQGGGPVYLLSGTEMIKINPK